LPSLIEVGLGEGGQRWMEWLMVAHAEDLAAALDAARKSKVTEHPDPRCRLANWGIDNGYRSIPDVVDDGIAAWEELINQGTDELVHTALTAISRQRADDNESEN